MRSPFPLLFLGSLLLVPGLAGCHVDTHKDGKNNDVSIGTPFGSMQVNTHDAASSAALGLTPYPGATVVQKKGEDDGAADVNLSFGNFKLGVHAVELQTGDPQDKVLTFYRRDMGRYGTVISCRGSQTVGQPAQTANGLTCDTDGHRSDGDDLELRTGSPQHQHIVSVDTRDGGTHIGLVTLDLPAGLNHHGDAAREE